MKVNDYFDGKVKSVAFENNEGVATMGLMDIGEYEFSTSKQETMTVVSGKIVAKLPGEDSWKEFNKGETFIVEANKKFNVKIEEQTAYTCFYK
ncbi:pyrimidine/purine nucleoside phosphorylase [Clostridium niameyense]|uniref:Pyrimidine/purine nucleoside phosphorylase n=1 Tax=Clostridium niameyense TaxID=1622073 RepID=A0A6M0RBH1_9CLOT|nr:pyrimidine/purine nucleoside phosphorylase [Clostridium niameyense]NEZ47586.1 pyrimidine/purine nucleoside phosphorylase [Clostridium niameyense]